MIQALGDIVLSSFNFVIPLFERYQFRSNLKIFFFAEIETILTLSPILEIEPWTLG